MSDSALTPDLAPPPFADARALVLRSLRPFRPPQRIDVADYAAANRWLSNPGGGYTGRWNHEEAPYLVGPMQALTSRRYANAAVVGPGQCGKTTIAENWLLHSVAVDPANMLWYMQTDRVMRDYVKASIDPLVETHEILRERLGGRSSDDTQEYKRFVGMAVNFMVAARTNLISRRASRIIADEIDAYDRSLGNVPLQLDVRRQTYGDESMVLYLSHPDLATKVTEPGWRAGIMQIYRRSTRGVWYWPCPHCNGWSSPNPTAARVMALAYPPDAPLDEIADAARLWCPLCGVGIEDHHRRAMNVEAFRHHGGWIAAGQEIDEDGQITGQPIASDTAGFWIVGVMSPFTMGGIGGLARARVEAERNQVSRGDDQSLLDLREVFTKRWGIPFEPPRQIDELAVTAEALAERAEPHLVLGQVPDGVRFLTAWADVQANGFRIMVRGWGVRGESWIIDVIRRLAEPSTSAEDWDGLLSWATTVEFPLADTSGRMMRLRAFGYDSGGLPGVTQHGYDVWLRFKRAGKIRIQAFQDGRAAWNVVPTKGLGTPNAQRLAVVRPDTGRKDRAVRVADTVQLAQFGANAFKDDLSGQLAKGEPGPWAVHIPAALKSAAPPHRFFEELVAERRKPNGSWEKITPAARNEALDQMVGNHVLAHLHGVGRLRWDAPPAWAAPWDVNSLVGDPRPASDAPPGRLTAGPAALPERAQPAAASPGIFASLASRMR